MRTSFCLLTFSVLISCLAIAQDTFSICAVDTVTGEVGSAGASCIDASAIAGGVVIISDVHPGVGVIHTQSYWQPGNQNLAKGYMDAGYSPQQILDSVIFYDVQANPEIRQYGAVDLHNGSARAAAFTGTNCFSYANHIIGPNYSIQGNILLGQQILDSMEARFLNTPGDLSCKLMAAMQGAKVPGADTRCLSSGNSSLSSFLRVACPGDVAPNFTLDLIVPQGPDGFEPIDSLQTLFDQVRNCGTPLACLSGITEKNKNRFKVSIMPNPISEFSKITINGSGVKNNSFVFEVFDCFGRLCVQVKIQGENSFVIDRNNFSEGVYFYRVLDTDGNTSCGKFLVQ